MRRMCPSYRGNSNSSDLDRAERQTVYSMLGLPMESLTNKSLKIRGVFGEETLVLGKRKNVETFLS